MFADASPSMHDPYASETHAPDAPAVPGTDRYRDAAATAAERTYATFTHLSLLTVHMLVPVVPALIMWLIKRHESPFLDDHGKEAVNFQISLTIYFAIGLVLSLICVGWVVIAAAYVLGIVGMIMAAMAANRGEYYRYPATIRLIA